MLKGFCLSRANFFPPKWDTDYRLSNKSIICDNVIRKANGVSRILKSEGGSATKYISCSIRVTYSLRRIHFELPLISFLWVTTAQRWPIPKNEIKTITILKKGWNFSTKEKADSYFTSPASIKVQVIQNDEVIANNHCLLSRGYAQQCLSISGAMNASNFGIG